MNYIRTDGKKPHRKHEFYGSVRWQKLRRACGVRDQYVCQMCGKFCPGRREGVADHKLPRATHPHLEWELSNLWWLCETCHNSAKRKIEWAAQNKPQLGVDGLNDEWKEKE
jgi:5-methylcytosine-specific restriction endonuclease McrA